jgi:hypothetical protein
MATAIASGAAVFMARIMPLINMKPTGVISNAVMVDQSWEAVVVQVAGITGSYVRPRHGDLWESHLFFLALDLHAPV